MVSSFLKQGLFNKLTYFILIAVEAGSLAFNETEPFSWPNGGPAFLAFVDNIPSIQNNTVFEKPPGLVVSQYQKQINEAFVSGFKVGKRFLRGFQNSSSTR